MKKMSAVLAALGGVAILAPLAGAALTDVNALPAGEYQAKYSDYSDLYVPGAAGAAYTPLNFGTTPAVGDEDRGIFYTSSIQPLAGPPATWLPGTPPAGQQLTGLYYNLNLAYAAITTSSGAITGETLYFTQSSRNPLPGTPANYGGVLEVYNSVTTPVGTPPNFTPDPKGVGSLIVPAGGKSVSSTNAAIPANWGPSQWVQGAGGASRDSYVGSNSGSLWLSGTFVDWATLAPYSPLIAADLTAVRTASGISTLDPVFEETLNLITGTGEGVGDVHLLGGSYYNQVGKGDLGLGPQVDLLIQSDLAFPIGSGVTGNGSTGTLYPSAGSYSGAGWWPVDSQDPVSFNVIPEPCTMTLLGLGLMGIGAIRRRAKKV